MSRDLWLSIETSGDSGGACLSQGETVLAEALVGEPRSHGSRLVPCIDEVFNEAGADKSELSTVFVNAGPGSYTGLRIGVSAAETLGVSLGVDVVGVPGLAVMAEQALADGLHDGHEFVIPALDARQGEITTQVWKVEDGLVSQAGEVQLIAPEKLAELAPNGLVFGQGATNYADEFPKAFAVRKEPIDIAPRAVLMAALKHLPISLGDTSNYKGKRVEIHYFRPIGAKTIEERNADARQRSGKRVRS